MITYYFDRVGGKIAGLYRNKQYLSQESLPETNAEIVAWFAAQAKETELQKINQEVNAYICDHYDSGTQLSFQAIYIMDTTPAEVKTTLLTVWAWVNAVLAYYYLKKAEITVAEDPATSTWDFSQFDATDPGVSLQSLIAG